ncbi:MAG: rhodanese-like domain-containing protein [Bacteriovoracaceae bacterium]|jgi:rhodanese-related sulfurtransferase|nr:rhodanese-like domain-containing protein [Bacteriovoracaceae bacterium]
MLVKIVFPLLFIGSLLASQSKETSAFHQMVEKLIAKFSAPTISVRKLRALINSKEFHEKYILIDTREPNEFKVSHLSGAKHGGYEDFDLKSLKPLLDKSKVIIVYCSLGYRSGVIAKDLIKAGYSVKNLSGGIFEWVNSKFSVVDQAGDKTNKIHGYNRLWGKWLTHGEVVY